MEDSKTIKQKNKKKSEKEKSTLENSDASSKDQIIKNLEEELKKIHTKHLYLQADFDNYKKQAIKEKSELLRYEGERLILALVNEVIDDFERAFKTYEEESSLPNFKKGMDLVQKKLQKVFQNFSIKSIDSTGKTFNPDQQEAIVRQKSSKVKTGTVLSTLKKTYLLHGKIIRYGQVIISEKEEDGKEESED